MNWIALFRGINVGGKNILSMDELIEDLHALGLKSIQTYIQSGNVLFESAHKSSKNLSQKIAAKVKSKHGFEPSVLLLSHMELVLAIESNPFPKAVADPKSLHFFFLEQPPLQPNITSLDNLKTSTEEYAIVDRVFYLYAPDGIGRSKLAASAERQLGVVATARNFRTVEKLARLLANHENRK